jgi:hypothetical protein
MPDLLAARSQMAMSLAFHIIFAVVGIGMPVLMVVAGRRWQPFSAARRSRSGRITARTARCRSDGGASSPSPAR